MTNLLTLVDNFNTDAKCRELLERLRWPTGEACLRCGSFGVSEIESRNQYDCNECRYQFSVTAGTILHDSHLPLRKWFMAIYLMSESKKGISALQLKRTLGVAYIGRLGTSAIASVKQWGMTPLKGLPSLESWK